MRKIAERLRADGLRVWFDEWELKPDDNIPARTEQGLEHSRVLVLCMSAHAFGSDWAQMESGTFRFRNPLYRERRFILLKLENSPMKGSLAQFFYIDWFPDKQEQVIFANYIHAHFQARFEEMQRLRYYVCPRCDAAQGNPQVLMEKLLEKKKMAAVYCHKCDNKFSYTQVAGDNVKGGPVIILL